MGPVMAAEAKAAAEKVARTEVEATAVVERVAQMVPLLEPMEKATRVVA